MEASFGQAAGSARLGVELLRPFGPSTIARQACLRRRPGNTESVRAKDAKREKGITDKYLLITKAAFIKRTRVCLRLLPFTNGGYQ